MDLFDLGSALFGRSRAETDPIDTDATTRTYVGTATSDSADGSVFVELSEDVTMPDEYEGENGLGVEMPTVPGVREGDEVIVTVFGGGVMKSPVVTGNAGEGDRQDARIGAIEADYVKATTLEADVAEIGFLKADSATITDLQADTAKVHDLTAEQLTAATGYVGELQAGSVSAQDIVAGKATVGQLAADHVSVSDLDAATARIGDLETDNVTITGRLSAAEIDIDAIEADYLKAADMEAEQARVGTLLASKADVSDLTAATARIDDLEADHVSVSDFEAEQANIDSLQAATADIDTIRANSAKVQNLTAAQLEADHAKVGQLDVDQIAADHATIGTLDTTYATIANLNAANGRITNLESTKANISDLEADYIKADEIEATYMHANMSNSDVAWIENGTIKNGAITSAMINDVSANKLTAGTINGSVINVTNLNADNITAGTINGQRIGEGSLSLDKLSEDVYTEAEVDNIVDGLNDRIDGAIETHTGTAVPTLNNSPASSWNTTKLRDEHVGDVYYVVNSQSQQNGYCYRFTKSGSTYSWQLIKDSDVTAALSRLTTAEGKITTFDSDISKLKTDTGTLTTKTESLETRMSDAEDDILDKVDTTTFNEVSDTVDQHSQTISQHTTAISNKADNSTVTAVTNRVSKNEQDISGINTTIGELQETVESKADGSTVSTISNKLNTVSDTVDGHTQTLTSVQNTLSTKADSSTVSTLTTKVNTIEDTVDGHTQRLSSVEDTLETKADGSTVSTLATKVNNVSDTVDGHTSQLSSITSTQITMQTTLDKTVKSSIQLWYSKANTTAPNKPSSKVTSDSTSGNAWRIVVPAYNASYPHYFYCWQYEYVDGTYGWSAVVRDIAMGESQSTARTADSNASAAVTTANTANTNASTALTTANTANANASDAKTAATTASTTASEAKTTAETAASDASTAKTNAASAVTTANSASTTATNAQSTANANIKSSVQLWFTKANSTAPSKPTSVVSTSNANTANAWNLVVPVWNSSYPHYYYCYQQQKGDGTYQWTDVVYDRATSEAQQLANTTSTSLSTLQTNYATFKQQTEQFESTIGTTYATKTELKTTDDKIENLEIGGRNLLRGSQTQDISLGNDRESVTETEDTWLGCKVFKSSIAWADIGFRFDLQVVNRGLVEVGDVLTYSIWAKTDDTAVRDIHGVWMNRINGGTHMNGARIATLTSKWTRYEKQITVTQAMLDAATVGTTTRFECNTACTDGKYIYWAAPKLEKGNRATDWTPAPEDTDADISAIESRVTNAETSITQTNNQVALKANSSDVYTKTAVDGKITQEVTDRNAAITAKANEITSTVSQNYTTKQEFADLEVGGRNLIRNTGTYDGWVGTDASDVEIVEEDSGTYVRFSPTEVYWSNVCGMPHRSIELLNGKTVTISCEVRGHQIATADGAVYLNIQAYENSTQRGRIGTIDIYFHSNDLVEGEWVKLTRTLTFHDDARTDFRQITSGHTYEDIAYFDLAIYDHGGFPIDFRYPKVEIGNKATDWSPAPEDIETRVTEAESQITQNATNINAKVSKNDVINQINLSTEGVLIDADRVEINGAAVFSAIKSSTDAAYDAKDAASTALSDAKTYADTKKSEAISTAAADATSKADAAQTAATNAANTATDNKLASYSTTQQMNEAIQGATGPLFYGKANSTGYIHLGHVPYAVSSASNYSHLHLTGRIGGWLSTTSGSIDVTFKSRTDNALYNTVDRRDETIDTSFVDVLVYTGTDGFTHYWIKVNSYWCAQLYAEFEQFVEDDHTLAATEPDGTCVWRLSEHTAVAATKSNAVKRTQRIYYRWNSATAPAAPASWVTKGDDGNALWTKMHVAITSTHKYIYTCEQYEMADGTLGHTDVLLDNTITVIDGGNIITGSVKANAISASSGTFDVANIPNLSAAKITSGTIDAARIDASQLTIGQSQVTGLTTALNGKADTSDIPTNVSDLTNDSGFQTSSQVESAITGKGYQTSSQVESAITSKGYQTSSQVNTAITSKGYQTSTQVESAITSKGYATTTQAQGYATTAKSEAISAAATDATTKANAAAKTATSYVTEITGQNGIMVHPSTDDDTGVRITSDVDIMRDGNSVLNVGTQGDTTSTDAGVTIYDGTASKNVVASFDSDEVSLGANSNSSTIDMCGGAFKFSVDKSDPDNVIGLIKVDQNAIDDHTADTPTIQILSGTSSDGRGIEILGTPGAQYPVSVVSYGSGTMTSNVGLGSLGVLTPGINFGSTSSLVEAYGGLYVQSLTGTNFWSTVPGTILWSGVYYMTSSHIANLTYNVSTCPTGIVLHFQPYTASTLRNYFHNYCFVPKTHVSSYNGAGVTVSLSSTSFANVGSKYLNVYDNRIVGNDANDDTGTAASGITFDNKYWVMTQVIAV